jgi:hypothetical protein
MKVEIMKNAVIAVSGVLAVAVSASMPAAADNHAEADVDPVELYICSLKEGKSMDDADKLDARYKKWADKNDKDYSAWRMTPVFRSMDEPFGFGYIGSWNSGANMGAGVDAWPGTNDGLGEDYAEVMDCSRALVASAAVHAPNGPPKDGLVWFSSCTVDEDSSEQAAYEAHKKSAKAMEAKGSKAQSWLFYPSLGFGKVDFDYYQVVTFNNATELGEGFDMYYNKGGWKDAAGAMGGVAECDSPRVYSVTNIRMGPQ